MTKPLRFPMLDDPAELARHQGWTREVYEDLLAVEGGRMPDADFDEKYLATRAILVLDVTGFTVTTIHGGAISSFLRILDAQKICFGEALPAFRTPFRARIAWGWCMPWAATNLPSAPHT